MMPTPKSMPGITPPPPAEIPTKAIPLNTHWGASVFAGYCQKQAVQSGDGGQPPNPMPPPPPPPPTPMTYDAFGGGRDTPYNSGEKPLVRWQDQVEPRTRHASAGPTIKREIGIWGQMGPPTRPDRATSEQPRAMPKLNLPPTPHWDAWPHPRPPAWQQAPPWRSPSESTWPRPQDNPAETRRGRRQGTMPNSGSSSSSSWNAAPGSTQSTPYTMDLNDTGPRYLPPDLEAERIQKKMTASQMWAGDEFVSSAGIILFGSQRGDDLMKLTYPNTGEAQDPGPMEQAGTLNHRVLDYSSIPFTRRHNTVYRLRSTGEIAFIPACTVIEDHEFNEGNMSIHAKKDLLRKGSTDPTTTRTPQYPWENTGQYIHLMYMALAAGSSIENGKRTVGKQTVACPFCLQVFGPPYFKSMASDGITPIWSNGDWVQNNFNKLYNHIWAKGSADNPDTAGKKLHPPVEWSDRLTRSGDVPSLVLCPDVIEVDTQNIPDDPTEV